MGVSGPSLLIESTDSMIYILYIYTSKKLMVPVLRDQGAVVTVRRSYQLHSLGMVGLLTHFPLSLLYRNSV